MKRYFPSLQSGLEKWNILEIGAYLSFVVSTASIFLQSYRPGTLFYFYLLFALHSGLMILAVLCRRQMPCFDLLHKYLISLCAVFGLSVFWASHPEVSVSKTFTMVQLSVYAAILYEYFKGFHNATDRMLKALYTAIALMVFYSVFHYGLITMLTGLLKNIRLGGDLNQINTWGMTSAYGAILGGYYFLKKKNPLHLPVIAACALCVLSSGSSKALGILGLGFLYFAWPVIRRHYLLSAVFCLLALAVILALGDRINAIHRINKTLNLFLCSGPVNTSSMLRWDLLRTAWQVFTEHPFFGLGADNYRFYLSSCCVKMTGKFGLCTYAHSNYGELLADLGMFGCWIYYFIYVFLLKKLSYIRTQEGRFVLFYLIVHLFVELMCVSYYSKETFILLVLYYVTWKQFSMRQRAQRGR